VRHFVIQESKEEAILENEPTLSPSLDYVTLTMQPSFLVRLVPELDFISVLELHATAIGELRRAEHSTWPTVASSNYAMSCEHSKNVSPVLPVEVKLNLRAVAARNTDMVHMGQAHGGWRTSLWRRPPFLATALISFAAS
jgi:hypothetical protein